MKILQLLNEIFLVFILAKQYFRNKTFEYRWKKSGKLLCRCEGKNSFPRLFQFILHELIHLLLYFLAGFPRENKYKLRASISLSSFYFYFTSFITDGLIFLLFFISFLLLALNFKVLNFSSLQR